MSIPLASLEHHWKLKLQSKQTVFWEGSNADFYAPGKECWASSFCPTSVCICLWLKIFNLGHNLWKVRETSYLACNTQLMKPFQMTPGSMTLFVTFILKTQLMKPFQMTPGSMTLFVSFILKITNLDFVAARGGFMFHKCILFKV